MLPLPYSQIVRLLACASISIGLSAAAFASPISLDSPSDLILHHAQAETVSFQGQKALRVDAPARAAGSDRERLDHLILIPDLTFTNGTIEVDVAGQAAPGATGGARGFVGVAFRVQEDRSHYDCFYLRPTNGRAESQERRNHTVQYISHPEFPWHKLRQDSPSRYESYVDIAPASWIQVRIEIDGAKARLFIDGREQPTLIVNDVKSGAGGSGSIGLWFEGSTLAHFANLKITPR